MGGFVSSLKGFFAATAVACSAASLVAASRARDAASDPQARSQALHRNFRQPKPPNDEAFGLFGTKNVKSIPKKKL